MINKITLIIASMTIGVLIGVIGTRKYYQNKYQEQYESDRNDLEGYYHRIDEYARKDHDEEPYKKVDQDEKEINSRPEGRMSTKERNEIRKKLNKNWKGTINYAGMYHEKGDNRITKEDEGQDNQNEPENYEICANCINYNPETSICNLTSWDVSGDSVCSYFENLNNLDFEAFEEHQKNKDRKPRIISAEAYENLSASVDQEVLYFYAYDEMLCDENEEPIEEPEMLVGDALTKYGFIDNDERIIFVMNYALDKCYEIQKFDASWTDSH